MVTGQNGTGQNGTYKIVAIFIDYNSTELNLYPGKYISWYPPGNLVTSGMSRVNN